jgi:NADH-quinone oxidoreductase subunit A
MLLNSEYFNISLMVLFVLFLSSVILSLSFTFTQRSFDTDKVSSYECGFDPYEDARNLFNIKFYLVGMLFIVFDLESLFFFPWVTSLSFITIDAFFSVLDFVFELIVGFIYAWRIGAFEWD